MSERWDEPPLYWRANCADLGDALLAHAVEIVGCYNGKMNPESWVDGLVLLGINARVPSGATDDEVARAGAALLALLESPDNHMYRRKILGNVHEVEWATLVRAAS